MVIILWLAVKFPLLYLAAFKKRHTLVKVDGAYIQMKDVTKYEYFICDEQVMC